MDGAGTAARAVSSGTIIYPRIPPLTTGFCLGPKSGGPIAGFDTSSRILPGSWSTLQRDFARHPPTYIVDVQADAKSAQYPVKNFPILAKLLAEQYQPVAHTVEGVIYRMR